MIVNALSTSTAFDDRLFLMQLLTGFFDLFRFGEMTYPNDTELQNPGKVTKRVSIPISESDYKFFLPGHKADRFFEGNTIIIYKNQHKFDLTPISLHIYKPMIETFHSVLPYGSPAKEPSIPAPSSFGGCATFLTLTQQANGFEPEVPHPLQKTAYPLQ